MAYRCRCCGRCDGVNDICVADMICEAHNIKGCEKCFGSRFNKDIVYRIVESLDKIEWTIIKVFIAGVLAGAALMQIVLK